ncbi:MAG: hypothetical protein MUQ10_04700 [Anaerolineae bacterium]|nr:hypothetical protein [Anaerolineae bacterium]
MNKKDLTEQGIRTPAPAQRVNRVAHTCHPPGLALAGMAVNKRGFPCPD